MTVLGISGLDGSAKFKRSLFPDAPPRVQGIVQGLDAAAALVGPWGILAAAEERFCRLKGTGRFPLGAIRFCLEAAGCSVHDLEAVAHAFDYGPHRSRFEDSPAERRRFDTVYSRHAQLRLLEHHLPGPDWERKLVPVDHHQAHAASCFALSGFDESLILVADGMGECHSMTLAVGRSGTIETVDRIAAAHSLGILYGVLTHFLGFRFGRDEYKVMGLAPYGNARRYLDRFQELVQLRPEGRYTVGLLAADTTFEQRETHAGALRRLADAFGPPRTPGERLTDRECDLAAALQATLERVLLHVLRHYRRSTGQRRLCMAGGVALNCSANGVIHRSRLFDEMYVQPAAGDDGAALGAALYASAAGLSERAGDAPLPYWGPAFDDEAVERALRSTPGIQYSAYSSEDALMAQTARQLAEGAVIGWYQGPMEFGPRALGNRSILADPRTAAVRDRINQQIKHRDDFQPFAPAVTEEAADRYFEIDAGAAHLFACMLATAYVRPEYRDRIPAVTHVDGTARVQVVNRQRAPRFWSLLAAFGRRTGIPILLNTSLNARDEPIACTPEDALNTFVNAQLDALAIGRFLATRLPDGNRARRESNHGSEHG